jgi:predicted phosphodiesterase
VPYLIVSDIHGNLEALDAVLADARGRYDRLLCLGDLVGYGADPNAVTDWARENVAVIVRGNHDKACTGSDPLDEYNPVARVSAAWTRTQLTTQNSDYLGRLPRGPLPHEGVDLVHGSPADEDEYIISLSDASMVRGSIGAALTFFGHTHLQGGFLLGRSGVKHVVPNGTIEIEPDYHFLINPGSIGQPRDGDWRAAYALYSPVEHVVEFCRVAYDVDRAAAKIRAAGLPEFLAARLYEGT